MILYISVSKSASWVSWQPGQEGQQARYQRVGVAIDYIRCDNLVWQNVTRDKRDTLRCCDITGLFLPRSLFLFLDSKKSKKLIDRIYSLLALNVYLDA